MIFEILESFFSPTNIRTRLFCETLISSIVFWLIESLQSKGESGETERFVEKRRYRFSGKAEVLERLGRFLDFPE